MSDNSINNQPLPTTPEETAYRLFNLICKGQPEKLQQDDILPLFAKCMRAVREPHDILTDTTRYQINLHQD